MMFARTISFLKLSKIVDFCTEDKGKEAFTNKGTCYEIKRVGRFRSSGQTTPTLLSIYLSVESVSKNTNILFKD